MLFCFLSRLLKSRPGIPPASLPVTMPVIIYYYRLIRAALAIGERPDWSMAVLPRPRALCRAICLGLLCAAGTAGAASMSDLLNQKDLTPEGLARGFSDFSFELGPQVQEPDAFLKRKRGDCADFANLASVVLGRHGYTTKLVVVMMSKQTHVICYVKEAGGFLDYNHRADSHPVIASNGSLEDIAAKVATFFRSDWRMASAFRYRDGSPVYLDSVFSMESSATPAITKKEEKHAMKARRTKPARAAEAISAKAAIQAMPD